MSQCALGPFFWSLRYKATHYQNGSPFAFCWVTGDAGKVETLHLVPGPGVREC